MKRYRLCLGAILMLASLSSTEVRSQSGNQMLDGIGETGLLARYIFDGDVKDWSRNNVHGTLHGSKAEFIQDATFGKVLSLAPDGDGYISIPGGAISGEESLSITAWVYLRSTHPGQRFFEFGNNKGAHFFVAPAGMQHQEGLLAEITENKGKVYTATAETIQPGQWNHLAVIINTPL